MVSLKGNDNCYNKVKLDLGEDCAKTTNTRTSVVYSDNNS